LASRYHLLRALGSGGMGTVWLARDAMLDREVAVKELRIAEGLDPRDRAELVARVMREAEITARLRHPAIVAVHDVLVEGGKPWLVMERLHGRDLGEEVARRGPMPPPVVAELGARVLEALSETHAHGVQHRDVKPGNVFLAEGGRVVLTDFGIARPDDQTALTEAGLLIGSPGFIAPERLAGEPGGPPADLWSLGATLYAAVEGVPPYGGSQADVIRATLTEDCRSPRLAGPLRPLLLRMMARTPQDRPDAATTLGLLRQIAAGGTPEIAPPSAPPRRTRRWIPVTAAVAVGASATVVALLAPWAEGKPVTAAKPVSPTFTRAVDLCGALSAADVGRLLGTATPPKGRGQKTRCRWTVDGAGLGLTAETDSDTPDPWSLTRESAHSLLAGYQKQYATGPRDGDWIWYEIGLDRKSPIIKSAARPVTDVADEAFASDMATPEGQVQASVVFFRLGNLVASLEYADLDAASAADVRGRAASAAKSAADRLRELAR
jgi:hypothetical protein